MQAPPLFPDLFPIPPLPDTQALSSETFKKPALDGSMTVPQMYDWHYENSPNHPVLVYADSGGSTRMLLWPEVVRAVHTAGKSVLKSLGSITPKNGNRPVVGILTSSDSISYFTLIVGIMRADCIPFLISPRNSAEAVAHLLYITHTDHVLISPEPSLRSLASGAFEIMTKAYSGVTLPTTSLSPTFEDLYGGSEADFELLPPCKSGILDVGMIMHSSGSTAFPKPRVMTHAFLVLTGCVPYFGERDLTGKRISCHAIPMYHGMGMMQTGWAAACGSVVALARPQSPAILPSPENVYHGAVATNSDVVFCVPTFVETWARSQAIIDRLRTTDGILYGGGPLNKAVGDALTRQGVKIFTLYGCTELGIMTPVLPRESSLDWEYFTITKQFQGRFVPNGFGQAEFVVVPNPFQHPCVINGTHNSRDAYYTSDLLSPHPSRPGYWKLYGRSDDQLIHSTGEKTNPGPLEVIVNQDPNVRSAVIFGHGRFNAGVIIDPLPQHAFDPSDASRLSQFRNDIWPTIQRMNAYAPQHSRLFKEMVLVASPSKPFEYTSKSTARRQAIIKAYADEIDAAYDAAEATSRPYNDIPPPTDWSLQSMLIYVRAVVHTVLQDDHLSDQSDIFQNGCDSLQATWIRNTILRAIKEQTDTEEIVNIPNDLVFEHPTIASLSEYISKAMTRTLGASNLSTTEDKIRFMLESVARHTQDFSVHVPDLAFQSPARDVVLITGTTGSIGARVLCELLSNKAFARVFAVNRRHKDLASLVERQKIAFQNQSLPLDLLRSDSLVLIETDMDDEMLGLSSALLDEIHASVTHIIHNAWRVDFNISLSSFAANIRSVYQIINLALSSRLSTPARVIFISSISVVTGAPAQQSVLEQAVDARLALANGYSQSKWVSEAILQAAAQSTPLRPTIVRVGQISGDAQGYWNTKEWFPAMVKSSIVLGCFPEGDAHVAWIPLDVAARFIVDIRDTSNPFIHLVHPFPTSWNVVAQAIASQLNLRKCSYSEWLAMLEASVAGKVTNSLPASKILPFFQRAQWHGNEAMGLPTLDTTLAQEASSLLDKDVMAGIESKDVQAWLLGWRNQGFLE